jgi:glycosyl transferase, family 25
MHARPPQTFVINLARRPDRRARMQVVLPAVLEPQFTTSWPGPVDGATLTPKRLDGLRLFPGWMIPSDNMWWSRPLKKGEVACAISHWLCWQRARDQDAAAALFLEDDTVFADDFEHRLEVALQRLDRLAPSWGLCYLGRVPLEPDLPFAPGMVRPGYSHCTFAYLLSRTGLEAVLAAGYDQALIPVDEFLPALYVDHPRADVRARFPRRLSAYAMTPPAVRQLPKTQAGSDTEDSDFIA